MHLMGCVSSSTIEEARFYRFLTNTTQSLYNLNFMRKYYNDRSRDGIVALIARIESRIAHYKNNPVMLAYDSEKKEALEYLNDVRSFYRGMLAGLELAEELKYEHSR